MAARPFINSIDDSAVKSAFNELIKEIDAALDRRDDIVASMQKEIDSLKGKITSLTNEVNQLKQK